MKRKNPAKSMKKLNPKRMNSFLWALALKATKKETNQLGTSQTKSSEISNSLSPLRNPWNFTTTVR
jgi:hypothetical protein